MSKPKLLMIAGGGTGGHVLAGIAVADAWMSAYGGADRSGARVVFVGARGGIEERLVPKAGYPLLLLKVGSLNRVSWSRRLRTLFELPLALLTSLGWIISHRPSAVLGVGGYASGPLVLMARFLPGTFTAILEQNSVPGFTNRMLGRVVHRVFCAFPGMEARFGARKVQLTGNPVRSQMVRLTPAVRDPFTVFIFGGSQGAQGINTLVLDALPLLKEWGISVRWIHQTGEKDFERVRQGYAAAGVPARVEKFIDDMLACYREASLVICRAGSSTLSEIAAVGRASVLIPLPTASDNHQEHNARAFSDRGAALLVRQQDSKGKDLARVIRDLHSAPARIAEMEAKVVSLAQSGSAAQVASALALGAGLA